MSRSVPARKAAFIGSPLFAGMNRLEFETVAAFFEPLLLKKGEYVFREGDAGGRMYVLCSGALSAFASETNGTERWLFDVKPGEFFGEMSIVAREPRSASIVARKKTGIMALRDEDFYRIVFEHPPVGVKLLRAISTVQDQWLDRHARYLEDLMRWGEAARRRAITDELTGLYNRRFLEESIKDRFEQGSVNPRKIALLMLDLDKVHFINDTYGAQAGDRVILTVAQILSQAMRTSDIAARLSGDEYAILLPDTNEDEALLVGERIRQAVEQQELLIPRAPGSKETVPIEIHISIGVAVAPTHAETAKDLFSVADRALHNAKEKGRNKVVLAC